MVRGNPARRTAYLGMMLCVIMVVSYLEHLLPALPMLPPGVRLGLSNVVVMYCVFFLRRRDALGLAALKSVFVAFVRGPVAGLLSLCGGLFSVLALVALAQLTRSRQLLILSSVCGAVAHNLGQIAVASLILETSLVFYYLPVLIVAGAALGAVTGLSLQILLPHIHRAMRGLRDSRETQEH